MQIPAYSVAKIICNLASLGWTPNDARSAANCWVDQQARINPGRLGRRDAKAVVRVEPALASGRVYLTGRFGCYPQLFRALAEISPGRTVYCPAGHVASELSRLTARLSALADCTVKFVGVTPDSIRQLKERLGQGDSMVVVADVPFRSRAGARELGIATELGEFQATTAIAKFPAFLDPEFLTAWCERRDGRDFIATLDCADYAGFVRELSRRVRADPAQYELLPNLHKQWRLGDRANIAVLFDREGERMLLHARDMRVWKLPRRGGLEEQAAGYETDEAREALGLKLGVKIDAIVTV